MSRIRVAIVSNDRMFTKNLRGMIAADVSLDLVGEQEQPQLDDRLPRVRPDVVLLDSRLPEAFRLGQRFNAAGSRIILTAAEQDDAWAAQALSAGAHGILAKNSEPGLLTKAIHVVHEGQLWARRQVLEARIRRTAPAVDAAFLEHRLTTRERTVLTQAARGMTNKEIAQHMAVCQATVKAHLSRIFQELGIQRRSQLAAAYHGILPPLPRRSKKR